MIVYFTVKLLKVKGNLLDAAGFFLFAVLEARDRPLIHFSNDTFLGKTAFLKTRAIVYCSLFVILHRFARLKTWNFEFFLIILLGNFGHGRRA